MVVGVWAGSFGWGEWEAAGSPAGFQQKKGKRLFAASLWLSIAAFPPKFPHLQPTFSFFFWHFPGCSDTSNPCEALTHRDPSEKYRREHVIKQKTGIPGMGWVPAEVLPPGELPQPRGRILTRVRTVLGEQPQHFTCEI